MIELEGRVGKDCKIFSDLVEEETIGFLHSLLDREMSAGVKVRVMPDQHYGTGCIVGLTIPVTSTLSPEYIGCDIGCGVILVQTKTKVPENPDLGFIDMKIRSLIPMGPEIHKKPVIDEKDFYKFLRTEYSKARSGWPEEIPEIPDISEKFIRGFLGRIGMDPGLFYRSLGTLGSGNHYSEVYKDSQGNWAFSIHCGSRNLGIKVWKYWSKAAKNQKVSKSDIKEIEERIRSKYTGKEIAAKIKDLHDHPENYGLIEKAETGFLDGDAMRGYLSDMVIAQAYAKYNRKTIVDLIEKGLRWKHAGSIEAIHNYIDFKDRILRKGAIRSYPGELMVIPMNMAEGIMICEGLGNPDWNYSAPHGLGRKMSRSKAKKEISLQEYQESMSGVFSTSVIQETLDEAPGAYKDPGEVISRISGETVKIIETLKPIINLKAKNILDRNEED